MLSFVYWIYKSLSGNIACILNSGCIYYHIKNTDRLETMIKKKKYHYKPNYWDERHVQMM